MSQKHSINNYVSPLVWTSLAGLMLPCTGSSMPSSGGDDAAVPYSIACRIEVEPETSLSAALVSSVEQQIQRVFAAILGSDHRMRFLAGPEASELPSLGAASSELLLTQWVRSERLILVEIGRVGNQYALRSREYDPRFQMLGPIWEIRTMQRELVADSAGRVVLQTFSPIAVVRAVTGTNVQLEFLGDSRLVNYRDWLGLSGDVGLQVMREPSGATRGSHGDAARATRYRHSFLALRAWQGNRAESELIGPDKQIFRDLDSGAIQYVARPVRGGNSTPRIRVVRKEGRQPQSDCEVFVSPQQYSTDPSLLRGLTDRTGTLSINLSGGGLQFVCVRYEDLVLKAPLLPGASADPMVFEVPTRGRRVEFIRPLRQLMQEVDDQYLVEVRLREELKARVEAMETAEVRRLIERGRLKRISLEEVESRLREIERRADAEGEDIREAAQQVRQSAAHKTSSQLQQTLLAFSDWADRFDKKSNIDSLNAKINELQEKLDWEGLVPLFEQLVEADPDNQKMQEELRLLKNDLKIKSPEHGQARNFVNDELKSIRFRDLDSRWKDVERAGRALVTARDHLTLMKVRRAIKTWARELGQEVKGLVDQIQAAGQDEDQVRELRDRLGQLDELNQSLTKLHKEIQTFLDTLKL